MQIIEADNTDRIRPLYPAWRDMSNGQDFGLEIDVDTADAELERAVADTGGTILVAEEAGEAVGFFVIVPVKSNLSSQMMALETHWFALPNARMAGPRLFKAARRWATEHGCSHLIVSGSWLSSDMHDKVCEFCQRAGAKPFETVYILEVV